ncbi:MAG: mechanosensitive ion channel [Methylococcales bacterium]|nr:mechanosensitive ion channel [Methylococcales bacterium]
MKLIVNMNKATYWAIFYFCIFFFSTSQTFAGETKLKNQQGITPLIVQKKIDSIKQKSNIEDPLRLRILSAYYSTEDNLDEQIRLKSQTQKYQQQLKNLPKDIKRLEKRISEIENDVKNKKPENYSLYNEDKLEHRLNLEKSKLNELISSINRLEVQISEHFKRPKQIRIQKVDITNNVVNTKNKLNTLVNEVSNKLELNARKIELESRLRKLNTMLAKLDQENIVYPIKEQAFKLEIQWLNLQRKKLKVLIKTIDDHLIEKRQQNISKTQEELIQAQKEAEDKHPLIKKVTNKNIYYNYVLQKTNKKIEQYLAKNNKIEIRNKQLDADFQSAEQKIDLAGLSPALGNILREQRRRIPLIKDFQYTFDKIQQETALASLELFKLDEVKKSLADINLAVSSEISNSILEISDRTDKKKIRAELQLLLQNQKELVLKLELMYSEYSRALGDVDFSLHQLVNLGEKFSYFLNQRLLWVPSAPVIDQNYILEIFDAIVWFSQISHWKQTANDIKHSIQNHHFITLLGLVIILLSIRYKKNIQLKLQTVLENSAKPYADRSSYTFYGFGYAFLLALPIPFFIAWLGGLLRTNELSTIFSHSVSQGLLAASLPLLLIQFFCQIFKPKGVVQSLFYWHDHSINLLYSQLKWMRFIVVPAIFIITMFADDAYYKYSYSLGRLALIVAMLVFSYVFHRLAHPVSGLTKELYQESPNSWIYRLRYIWYGLVVLIPLVIIGFAIAGYYQSALELQGKLVILIRIIFFTTLLHETIIRAMFLANRQLALQNARQKRKLQEQAENNESTNTVNIEEEPLLDIPKINQQSKTILNAMIIAVLAIGSWITLQDIIPALSIFNQVVLWQHMVMVEGQELLQPVTLFDIFICLVYLFLMSIFVKNFPGLTDLFLAGKFSMAAGSRYALNQLTRYAVISITFIAIASKLGGSWSQVQWLVAAISVGLGFGLQEIFANMVSGIILLFERPVRVGDTVTVGDITGKVCRIKMRATTLIDWDQKELIIPNKTFITDKLINWSLSDTITRIVIPVGVSYDADEALTKRLLIQLVKEAPLVLQDPEPSVYFIGFGDSSLDFSVRVFVRELSDRLPVTDDLHRKIRQVFKEHNIEIPFPQRDLHIKSAVKGM